MANQKLLRWLIWLAPLAAAMGLKWALVAAQTVPFNSDEAVVALMGRHILEGRWPVFFYGQVYMGSLDAALVALGFAIFGQPVWVIRLVQALLYLGVLITTVELGKAIFGSRWVGLAAAWMLAIPTVNVTLYTTASLGGYGEALLLGNLMFLIALRIAEKLEAERRPEPRGVDGSPMGEHPIEPAGMGEAEPPAALVRGGTGKPKSRLSSGLLWALWGFLAGLGLWAFGISLVFSLPSGIYLLTVYWKKEREGKKERERGREGERAQLRVGLRAVSFVPLGLALVGAVAGAAPWWGYALSNGFERLVLELRGEAIAGVEGLPWLAQVGQHVFNFLLLGVTVIFGLRPPWEVRWLAMPLLPFVLIFWMAVVLYSFQRLPQAVRERRPALLLWGVFLTLLAAFLFTPFGADPSGRYFVPLAVPLALLAAEMIHSFRERIGRWTWGLVALVVVFHLWGTVQAARRVPPGLTTQFDDITQIDHSYDDDLIRFLRSAGETRGYSNYWLTYPLAFLSQEELIFTPRLPYHDDFRYTERDDRYAPYREQVAEAERVAYITTNHPDLDNHLRQEFERRGIGWQEVMIGDYHVFYALTEPVRPQEMGLGVTTSP